MIKVFLLCISWYSDGNYTCEKKGYPTKELCALDGKFNALIAQRWYFIEWKCVERKS